MTINRSKKPLSFDSNLGNSTYGNGLQDNRAYDLQGRLIHQSLINSGNIAIDERTYRYDPNSNVINLDTNYEDNAYQYDKRDRLISDQIDQTITSVTDSIFNYDLNDNRLSQSRNDDDNFDGDTLYSYQNNSNRLLLEDTIDLTETQAPTALDRRMVYNDVGRLFQVFDQEQLVAEYIYNDQGQRIRKTIFTNTLPTEITIYHYNQQGLLITETDENGSLKRDYIWSGHNQPLAQIDHQSGSDNIVYLHNDHLMTNRLATNQSQTIVWRWEGEAFGATPAEQDPDGDSNLAVVNLRFPGQYFDSESSLHYNWNRYYDPTLGRYITSDPIGLDGGLNTYGYVSQNPERYIDPEGLVEWTGDQVRLGLAKKSRRIFIFI